MKRDQMLLTRFVKACSSGSDSTPPPPPPQSPATPTPLFQIPRFLFPMTLFSPCPYYLRARRRLFQTLISNDLWYEKWCDHLHDVTSTGQRKLWVPDRKWTYNPLFVSDFYKCTVEPRRHEGPRDWQNLLAIPMFRYIEVLFDIIILLLLGWRNFRYTEDLVM